MRRRGSGWESWHVESPPLRGRAFLLCGRCGRGRGGAGLVAWQVQGAWRRLSGARGVPARSAVLPQRKARRCAGEKRGCQIRLKITQQMYGLLTGDSENRLSGHAKNLLEKARIAEKSPDSLVFLSMMLLLRFDELRGKPRSLICLREKRSDKNVGARFRHSPSRGARKCES